MIYIDGFTFDSDSLDSESFLVVNPNGSAEDVISRFRRSEKTASEFVDYINEKGIENVIAISDDFSFLEACPHIKRLCVYPSYDAPNHISMDGVYALGELRDLDVHLKYGYGEKKSITFDCKNLNSKETLESFGSYGKNGIKNIAALNNLKTLALIKNRSTELYEAIGSEQLDTLWLLFCGIKSLDGINLSKRLQVLCLDGCRALEDISALESVSETLKGLRIDGCSKVKDFSVLGKLKKIARLCLWGRGSIPNIDFIEQMPCLKSVSLGLNVENGRLSALDRIGWVGLEDRRHYDRKSKDFVPKGEVVRGDEGIDEWRRGVIM